MNANRRATLQRALRHGPLSSEWTSSASGVLWGKAALLTSGCIYTRRDCFLDVSASFARCTQTSI